jgi:hypothetical protein
MKKTLRYSLTILLALIIVYGCKKQFADPTYAPAGGAAVRVWYKSDPFYQPNAEIFFDSTGVWRSFRAFPLVYDNDPNKYGFGNPYVPGKGSNALYMTSIYSRLPGGISADSGYYNITIPKCFEFIPDATNAKTGKVQVIEQKVRLYRRDKTFYDIGISGEGTYNVETTIFEVEVIFDETAIGGPKEVKRKYRFKP